MLIDALITPDHTAVKVGSCELEMVGLPGKALTMTTTDEGQRRGKKILFSCLIINCFFLLHWINVLFSYFVLYI